MILLYILLIAYIIAINFYAFILVKSLRDKEKQDELNTTAEPVPSTEEEIENGKVQTKSARPISKLCITGVLGGAITIYLCMFILKYRQTELLLMVLMPLLGVLNVYLWVLLFRSGFSFFMIR